MSKKKRTGFPFRLLRIQLVLFAVLLVAALIVASQYPKLCLSIGRSALENGNVERAAKYLARSDTEEARLLLSDLREVQIAAMIEAGSYEEAQALLAGLNVTDPSDERVAACLYGRAQALIDGGAYGDARELLSEIPAYRDASERKKQCEHALAFAAFSDGDIETALSYIRMDPQDPDMRDLETQIALKEAEQLLASDDPHSGLALLLRMWQDGMDVQAQLLDAERRCYPDLYGDKDDAFLLEELRHMDESRLEMRSSRLAILSSLPQNAIAVGNAHTVLLRENGTVLASGDNQYGQCDVGGWTDVVAVACGAYHTLGLRADGSVLAVGNDQYGQCSVSDVRNAVEIRAYGFDTAIRCADGRIICLGSHDYSGFDAWTELSDLALGGYALLGLRADGTAYATAPSYLTGEFRALIMLDAAGSYAAGVTEDGHVVVSAPNGPEWENMISVSAAASGLAGLPADGTVKLWLEQPGDYDAILARSDVVAAAFSGRHLAALTTDGTLLVCGANEAGQCDLTGSHR